MERETRKETSWLDNYKSKRSYVPPLWLLLNQANSSQAIFLMYGKQSGNISSIKTYPKLVFYQAYHLYKQYKFLSEC